MLPQVRVAIGDRSEIGAARRAAAELTQRHQFDATQAGKASLCVTEAATNIFKHAGRGELLLRILEHDGTFGLELLALDQGPGIANLAGSLRDGVSTAGSPGTGLGAMARASDTFEVYAPAGRGTVVLAEIWSRPVPPPPLQMGAICIPKSGESVSGDSWAVATAGNGNHVFMVADGLGHGSEAARASIAATQVLMRRPGDPPGLLIETCHRALASTRGAAVAIARLVTSENTGSFAGVGNIAARIELPTSRRQLVSHNGTLGHTLRRVQQFEFTFDPAALLILHSDGMNTHWNLADYPGLAPRHAGLIAGVLYRDHQRGRDDVTVLVIRNQHAPNDNRRTAPLT
jgi:anti-sigma regulatory factor (Ser/Thr protein kinase)